MPAAPCAWPAAVSPMGDALLAGPAAEARVLAAFPAVLYLQLGRHEDVLPVLAADALRLPTGMCLARRAAEICWGVSAGDVVQVGAGRVRLPQADVVAVRRLRPERVAGTGSTPVAAMVRAAASICNLRLHAPLRADCADLTRAALAGRPVHHQVARLVGAGPGLTPSGDDALCGVLLLLQAASGPRPRRAAHAVAQEVRSCAGRTTGLAASLLLAAAQGYAVPEVVRLVRSVAAGDRTGVGEALPRVLAIGHSSGADLVAGMQGALDALRCGWRALPAGGGAQPVEDEARSA